MHYQRSRRGVDPVKPRQVRGNDLARFWATVDSTGGPTACWPWPKLNYQGYGTVYYKGKTTRAHRFAYQVLVGPIPEGLVLDHTCHDPSKCSLDDKCPHRACCNPAHLEPVTQKVNNLRGNAWSGTNARKTHCIHGHELTAANVYLFDGSRQCRECHRARSAASTSG